MTELIWTRLFITSLLRSKHLLISRLQSPSAVILEPPDIKSVTVSIVSNGRSNKYLVFLTVLDDFFRKISDQKTWFHPDWDMHKSHFLNDLLASFKSVMLANIFISSIKHYKICSHTPDALNIYLYMQLFNLISFLPVCLSLSKDRSTNLLWDWILYRSLPEWPIALSLRSKLKHQLIQVFNIISFTQ